MDPTLAHLLEGARRTRGPVVALTGAGVSAESGIPTFRSGEGYWVVGSRHHVPQEMATAEMFARAPEEVWRWFLARFGACRDARPNAGHAALAALARAYGDRFALVTQNIDGLHLRAGSPPARTFRIHGDAGLVRCAGGCVAGTSPLPDLGPRGVETPLTGEDRARLSCPRCRGWLRPHVLFFDECYDEENYRAESAMLAAGRAALLVVAGTSGATNLPMQIGELAWRRGIPIVDVNPEPNPFAELAAGRGVALRGASGEWLPRLAAALGA